MSKISILLPTYNRLKLLPQALSYVKNQTFQDWELIIVNDGGEDASSIVDSFNEPRFKYYNKTHEGKAAALNFALSFVTGQYIGYMDDDDEIYAHHLETLYTVAEKLNKAFVYSDTHITHLDENNNVIEQGTENIDDVNFMTIRHVNKINHKQILHTKELAEKVGLYDEKMSILIDYDYIRRLAKIEEPHHIKEITGNHIHRMSSATDGFERSITGLWKKDPKTCGLSIIALFEKTPEDLASLYQMYAAYIDKEKRFVTLIRHCEKKNVKLTAMLESINKFNERLKTKITEKEKEITAKDKMIQRLEELLK